MSSTDDARQDFRASLRGLDLPEKITTPYGEVVDTGRVLDWLADSDQPTLHAMAAVIRAAREQGPEVAA